MPTDPLAQMARFLDEEEQRALDALAAVFGHGWGQVPQLVRLVEDAAIVRRVKAMLDDGERSTRHALIRTAREFGLAYETARYRYHQAVGRRPQRKG